MGLVPNCRMRFLIFLIVFGLCLSSSTQDVQAAAILDAPRMNLAGNLAFLTDPEKRLTIDQVRDPLNAERFTALSNTMSFKPGMRVAWLRFTLKNPLNKEVERWLELEPAFFAHVDLYVPQPDGEYDIRRVGSSLPFSANEMAYRLPIFKLKIPVGASQTYYLRIESNRRSNVTLRAWEPSTFLEAAGKEQFGFGLYLGMYALMGLASLWFMRAIRDRLYFFFSQYVFACILATLTTTGMWQQYVMPQHPEWFSLAYGFSVKYMMATAINFFLYFVEAQRHWPKLTRLYLRILWGCSVFFFLALLISGDTGIMDKHASSILYVIVPLSFFLILPAAWRASNEVRYACAIGITSIVSAYLYNSLARFDVIGPTMLSRSAMYASSMAFFLAIFYSISRRYRRLSLATEAAQSEMLTMSRVSAQKLEKQVALRTQELLEAVHATEAALLQAHTVQKEQRHFIATVSHELRTPLAVIDATTQNMERAISATPEKSQARVQKIRQATQRLSLLLNDYLKDDRFGELAQSMVTRKVMLLPLLQDAVEAARVLSDSHVLEICQADTAMEVWADPQYLRLVLRTLVDNAVKYTPPGTSVVLHAQAAANGWNIDVADVGQGIPVKEQTAVFEYYFRGRASGAHIGTGLGLPLARKFSEMLGGTLELLSSDANGTVLRLFLPCPPVTSSE